MLFSNTLTVPLSMFWEAMKSQIVPHCYISAVKKPYSDNESTVRIGNGLSPKFQMSNDLRVGAIQYPLYLKYI